MTEPTATPPPVRDRLIAAFEEECAAMLDYRELTGGTTSGQRCMVQALALAVIASSLLHSSDADGVLHVVTEDDRP